ncbi:MAG: VRR-NUC domain protein [Firmicutes bacterium ADurb.Bin419]|nr:MAG: VRR-NUC domain protein [Firmicutes bacterium ADurb.Bin419]
MEGEKMRESSIESKLRKAVKGMGGIPVKLVASSLDGMPDRLILLPDSKMAFIELKAPGKKLRPLQEKRKRQLQALGFLVYCIDETEKIGGILDEIRTS